MSNQPDSPPDAVAEYKRLLRQLIAIRPSGIRRKIATETGTHPSFISQLTNPSLRVPLPAQHIPAIFRICHFSPEEQRAFLDVYSRAHPAQFLAIDELAEIERNVLRISVPNFGDPEFQVEVESTIRDFSDRIIGLARRSQKRK